MLPKKYRLLAKDFPIVYRKGDKLRGKYGMLISLSTNNVSPRFGFVVNKKIGNAVHRHRLTRLLRVIVMEAITHFSLDGKGIDYEYISFEYCDSLDDLREDLFKLIETSIQ